MTPSELKAAVIAAGTETHFFDRQTMQFFGDTMRNYGVCSAKITDCRGDPVECWELYRKRPVKHGIQSSAYFDKTTLKRAFPAAD